MSPPSASIERIMERAGIESPRVESIVKMSVWSFDGSSFPEIETQVAVAYIVAVRTEMMC